MAVVQTPRNIDLPFVIVNGSMNQNKKKKKSLKTRKILCTTCWLFGLLFLCIVVFVMAQYLLPTTSTKGGQTSNNPEQQISDLNCQDFVTLEQKIQNSDIIVAGLLDFEKNILVRVSHVLKDSTGILVGDNLRLESYLEECHQSNKDFAQVFFLGETNRDSGFYRILFKSLQNSPKLMNIIGNVVSRSEVSQSKTEEGEIPFHVSLSAMLTLLWSYKMIYIYSRANIVGLKIYVPS